MQLATVLLADQHGMMASRDGRIQAAGYPAICKAPRESAVEDWAGGIEIAVYFGANGRDDGHGFPPSSEESRRLRSRCD